MSEKFILALDQGTSSSRAIVFDHEGTVRSVAQKEFTQHFPKPGWVEHDPKEIWSSEAAVIAEAISAIGVTGKDIAGIGITNQRETTIVWDAETGEPVYNAIVWQDRRTSEYCDSLKAQGLTDMIREKTGLIVDAYFSGTKIRWILENVPGEQGKRLNKENFVSVLSIPGLYGTSQEAKSMSPMSATLPGRCYSISRPWSGTRSFWNFSAFPSQ